MRPIIAGPVCPTHRLSNFVDIILKPLTKYVPSFVRDDLDFLNHLPKSVENDSLLVTYDVNSLCTNIPHDAGIEGIIFWLEKHYNIIDSRFTKDFIIDSVRFILTNNSFCFNHEFYLQIRGTAMGTKMAPTYATLFMGYLEMKLYSEIERNFASNIKTYVKENWLRYLDDCFIIWKADFGDITPFNNILQQLHPNITFKFESSNEKISFLDISVINDMNTIKTDIFYKVTDTHQYLHFKSCHPRHCKINVPYNLARRICTIVSDVDIRKKRLSELKVMLKAREYPETVIQNGIEKAEKLSIEELRSCKPKTDNVESISFVHTHNPNNPNVSKLLKESITTLSNDKDLNSFF